MTQDLVVAIIAGIALLIIVYKLYRRISGRSSACNCSGCDKQCNDQSSRR